MTSGSRREAPRPAGAVAAVAAAVVALTGVALGSLPGVRALRLDHGLVPVVVDEATRAAVVVVAAVAAVAGGARTRRSAGAVLAVHALATALARIAAPGPVGLARWAGPQAAASALLVVVLAVTGARTRPRAARRWVAAGVVLAAGLTALPGLRAAPPLSAVGGAVADAVRTSPGAAVAAAALAGALACWWFGADRSAGQITLAAAVLAVGSAAGDGARWWGEGRSAPVGVLAARAVVALAAAIAAGGMLRRPGTLRRRAGPASGP